MSKLVTLGADPEFFITDRTGIPHPVCGLLGGTKERPIRMSSDLGAGFTMQEDNVMVEFNIPPAPNSSAFVNSIQSATKALSNLIVSKGYLVSPAPELQFPAFKLTDDKAMQFGCSPDFSAHTNGGEIERLDPNVLKTPGGAWRFAGGHVHIGYQCDVPQFVAASFADVFIGLRMVSYDTQVERRKFYGQAGRYRPTRYGIEYRTLSNFWIWDYGYIMEVAMAGFRLGEYLNETPTAKLIKDYSSMPWESVKDAINNRDQNLANQCRNFCATELGWEN